MHTDKKGYYAVCVTFMAIGAALLTLAFLLNELSSVFLLLAGSLVGAGVAGFLQVKISSESEAGFQDLIRKNFDVYFQNTRPREKLDKILINKFFVYYLTEIPDDNGPKSVWKVSLLDIDNQISSSVATGTWTLPTPNASQAKYFVEVLGLKGKIALLCQSIDRVEHTCIFILNRSQLDNNTFYGVHHAVSWTNRERVAPCILSKEPISNMNIIEDVRDELLSGELTDRYKNHSFVHNQLSELDCLSSK